jgi:PPOX class probable F420-dependent enzyme
MGSQAIPQEAVRLFSGKNFAFIATLMKDGSPQLSPVWIDVNGDTILVNTAEGRVKHRNVSRDPRVAISVFDSANPYMMVTVRGRVVAQEKAGAESHIDTMAKKYLGMDKYPGRAPGEKRILLRIKPEKVFVQKPPR